MTGEQAWPDGPGIPTIRQGWLGSRRPVYVGQMECAKTFDHQPDDDRTAVQLLLICTDQGEWLAKPRCAKHPADDDVHLLARTIPRFNFALVNLEGARPSPFAAAVADVPTEGIRCGHCGSTALELILGGPKHGHIACASCGEQLDPPGPPNCPGCGVAMEADKDGCLYHGLSQPS